MSSIQLNIDFAEINTPIATALANLVLAIGAESTTFSIVTQSAPSPSIEAPAPVAQAPAPVAQAPAPVAQAPTPADPKVLPPTSPVAAPKVAVAWPDFVGNLSPVSQAFLTLIADRERLTMSAAIEALELTGAKALGGLTGALNRKAAKLGVTLPYVAIREDGERVWVSTDGAVTAAAVTAAAMTAAAVTAAAMTDAAVTDAAVTDAAVTDAAMTDAAMTAPEPTSEPDVPPEPTVTWPEFVERLSPSSQAFLSLLRASERVSMSLAVSALGLQGGKALGGLTGALQRRASRAGFGVPFSATRVDGERIWTWTGDTTFVPTQPTQPTQPKQPSTRSKSKPTSPTQSWPAFRAGLSPDTNTFIDLVIARKRLTLALAVEVLNKNSGKAVGGLVGALQRKANGVGIDLPFSAGKSRAGTRIWSLKPKRLEALESEA